MQHEQAIGASLKKRSRRTAIGIAWYDVLALERTKNVVHKTPKSPMHLRADGRERSAAASGVRVQQNLLDVHPRVLEDVGLAGERLRGGGAHHRTVPQSLLRPGERVEDRVNGACLQLDHTGAIVAARQSRRARRRKDIDRRRMVRW